MFEEILTGDEASKGIWIPPGKHWVRVLFKAKGGSIQVQESLDDVDENYIAAKKPNGSKTWTTTVSEMDVFQGGRFMRAVGSGGIKRVCFQVRRVGD